MDNTERIRSLESSREISRGKLKMLFRKCEELDKEVENAKAEKEKSEKRMDLLLSRIDFELDRLITFEKEVETLKKNSHTHKVVM